MLKRINKFFKLSWREQSLFLITFLLTGVVRLAILLLPFSWLTPILGKHMQESSTKEDTINLNKARLVGRVVITVSRYTPWESKCLVQAIVGKILLRNQRIATTLYLGVAKDEEKGLVAHAWLRCGNVIITGCHQLERFAIVGKFADVERLIT